MDSDPADVIRSPGPSPEQAAYDGAADDPARYVTELFRAHHLELVRLAVLMVGDIATAEDVVQDAFERHEARISTSSHQDTDAAAGFEQRSELIEAFCRLPTGQREVLALRYYVDMSVADAAATLHISEGAVRSTASRGLDALARILPSRSAKEA